MLPEASDESLVSGLLRETRPAVVAPPHNPAIDPSLAHPPCLATTPSLHSILTSSQRRPAPSFPHVTHPSTCPSPHPKLRPTLFRLHTISTFPISSPSPPPLPSSSYPHSQTAPQPGSSLSFLWICLLIFRREPPPFHICRSQPGLAVAPAFSRVARTLCWWEEDKPRRVWKLSLGRLARGAVEPQASPRQKTEDPDASRPSDRRAKGGSPTPASQVRTRDVQEVGHSSGRDFFLT